MIELTSSPLNNLKPVARSRSSSSASTSNHDPGYNTGTTPGSIASLTNAMPLMKSPFGHNINNNHNNNSNNNSNNNDNGPNYPRLKHPLLDITNKVNTTLTLNLGNLNAYTKSMDSPTTSLVADIYDNFHINKAPKSPLFKNELASRTSNDLNAGLPRSQPSASSLKTMKTNDSNLLTPSGSFYLENTKSLSQEWYDKSDYSPLPHKSCFNNTRKLSSDTEADNDHTDNDDLEDSESTDVDESNSATDNDDHIICPSRHNDGNDNENPPYLGSSEVESDNDYQSLLREDENDYLSMAVPLPPPPSMNSRFKGGKGKNSSTLLSRPNLLKGSLGALPSGHFSNTSLSSVSSMASVTSMTSFTDCDTTFTADSASSLCLPESNVVPPSPLAHQTSSSVFDSFLFPPSSLSLSLSSSLCTSPISSALPSPVPSQGLPTIISNEKTSMGSSCVNTTQRTVQARPIYRKAISANNVFLKPNPVLTAPSLFSNNSLPYQSSTQVESSNSDLTLSTLESVFHSVSPPRLKKFNLHRPRLASSSPSDFVQRKGQSQATQLSDGSPAAVDNNNSPCSLSVNRPMLTNRAYYQGLGMGKKVKIRRTQSMYQHPHDVVTEDTAVLGSVKTNAVSTCAGENIKVGSSPSPSFSHISSNSLLFSLECPIKYHSVEQDPFPRITRETLCDILDGKFSNLYSRHVIVDCRFEYEYQGGHIQQAVNISSIEQLQTEVMGEVKPGEKVLVIMHCEYSAYRGPLMANHLRNMDRKTNMKRYPELLLPDIVLLQGGYKAFFESHANRCEPQRYVEMNCSQFKDECEREMGRVRRLKFARSKSANSYNWGSKSFSSMPTSESKVAQPLVSSQSLYLDSSASTSKLASATASSFLSPPSSSSVSSTSSWASNKIISSANSLVANSLNLASKSKSTLGLGLTLRRTGFPFPSLPKDDSDEEMDEDYIDATPTQKKRGDNSRYLL
ncbi:hypothetical protein NADFUDRAFT_64113 [Nadsonia fulvescens var. elongata DSM 6958]|uniref:M-phase inducer phosphatase n=1 Tax=Nadsonia fulvescens var. elongata DSM 6958 TaxID=857566 RepID=A0A1E3PNB2_9ASCO|nr:hypothetical protein NADFUDRAFT_64113 [Nadsonia fulvescens var. elongata DSM 6958]